MPNIAGAEKGRKKGRDKGRKSGREAGAPGKHRTAAAVSAPPPLDGRASPLFDSAGEQVPAVSVCPSIVLPISAVFVTAAGFIYLYFVFILFHTRGSSFCRPWKPWLFDEDVTLPPAAAAAAANFSSLPREDCAGTHLCRLGGISRSWKLLAL